MRGLYKIKGNPGWIHTFSGKIISLESPSPEDIDIGDIAHALSLICRFGGHVTKFYSVAEHSIRVSYLLPKELHLWGLLHDASEAYLIDLPRPIKHYIGIKYRKLEEKFMEVICNKFGLEMPEPSLVKICDNILLVTERKSLLKEQEKSWGILDNPLNEKISPWGHKKAERIFLDLFSKYN